LKIYLFDQVERTEKETASFSEPEYDCLNRIPRKDYELVRNILEDWFNRYPDKYKAELRSRFRAGNENYRSAFYELYVHELLVRFGYDVEVHPYIKGKSTHPEFLVYKDEKPLFYLEATVVSHSDKDKSAFNRENMIYDLINKRDYPYFFLDVRILKSSAISPSGMSINRKLKLYLSGLNPENVEQRIKEFGSKEIPSMTIEESGWVMKVKFQPKPSESRGNPSIKPIGLMDLDMGRPREPKEHIRKAIKEKNSKYGELNLALIVAINIWNLYFSEDNFLDALFGEKVSNFVRRIPNGAWNGPQGPRCTRVSAVLYSFTLNPYHIAKQTPILWQNPWARHPLCEYFWPMPQKKLSLDTIETVNGKNVNEILDLPENWPILEDDYI
jgi:hypothetical protein